MTSIFANRTAKGIFTRCFVAVYKDVGVSPEQLRQWVKLTLYFEDPSKTLKPGSLWLDSVPKYCEPFQTGVYLCGFGFFGKHLAALRKYWTHEWLITAILGRQTVDSFNKSPLLKQHDYQHVTPRLIEDNLDKFVGEIVQRGAMAVFEERNLTKKELDSENKLDHHIYNSDNELDCDTYYGELREKQCHSIELLSMDDSRLEFRVKSDALFSCRAFIRDLGHEINCPISVDQLHLKSVGPVTSDQALRKHEIHYDQMVECAEKLTPICKTYLEQLRNQYPEASAKYRFI